MQHKANNQADDVLKLKKYYNDTQPFRTMTSKIPRPPNVGTSADVPDDLCSLAHLQRNNVIAWVTLDEQFEGKIGHVTCCASFGVFVFLPCFWPHLLIIWPCLLAVKLSADRVIRNTYWILTTTEIKVIVKSHAGCCGTNGDQVKSIPLDTITDCGVMAKNTACCKCYEGVPTIYVDTASSGARSSEHSSSKHEAVGHGLAGYDWFMAEILARRETLKGHNNTPHHLSSSSSPIVYAHAEMERGESSTVESRLQKIIELRNLGVLSEVEYEKKRQDIIASI